MNFELLWWMFGAHFIGDIALQSQWVADTKGKRFYVLLSHCIIWTVCLCVPLKLSGIGSFNLGISAAFLLLGHILIDNWKSKKPKDNAHWHLIYIDQSLHFLQIFFVWFFVQ